MTNLIKFPAEPNIMRTGGRQAICCDYCGRVVMSNALTLGIFQKSMRHRGWWFKGPESLCPECLDGQTCPDCGHDNCGRYWTRCEAADPCDCHAVVDLLDQRIARALADAGPLHWSLGTALPPMPGTP